MRLTYGQIEQVWINAGGSRSLAPVMAAIAMAESGGSTTAHNNNPSTGDDSYGLWQINYFGSLRGPRTQAYGLPQSMYDPANNARAAVDIEKGGLGNWTTWTSGAWRQFYNPNTQPSPAPVPLPGQPGGGPPIGSGQGSSGGGNPVQTGFPIPTGPNPFTILGGLSDVLHGKIWQGILTGSGLEGQGLNPLDGIASAIATTFSFIVGLTWFLHPENWLRILSGTVGVIVLGFAIYLVSTAS